MDHEELLLSIENMLERKLQMHLDPIKKDISELKVRVTKLEADVAELKGDVAELKSDVAELKSDVAELKSDVAVLKMDVENLKAATAELKDEVTGLDVRMSNMEYKFDVLTREVTQLKDNVIDLTGRTANLEKSSERTNSRLDSIEKCLQEQRESLKRIEVIHLENNLIPRVANIESCYLTTFERYKAYTDRLPELFATVSNVSRTVQAHSEAFRKIS